MKVLSVVNQKGGVGKTTLSFHLAKYAEKHTRVLVVDADPQGNLTVTLKEELPIESHVARIFDGKMAKPFPLDDRGNLQLIGSDIRLSVYEADTRFENFFRLKKFLKSLEQTFDLVIVDCPPSLGLFTVNALVASTHILIPTDISIYAVYGIEDLLETISKIREYSGNDPEILGFVIMSQFERTIMGKTISDTLYKKYGELIIGEVPHSIKIREAVSVGRPVWEYIPGKKPAQKFFEVVKKIMGRMGIE